MIAWQKKSSFTPQGGCAHLLITDWISWTWMALLLLIALGREWFYVMIRGAPSFLHAGNFIHVMKLWRRSCGLAWRVFCGSPKKWFSHCCRVGFYCSCQDAPSSRLGQINLCVPRQRNLTSYVSPWNLYTHVILSQNKVSDNSVNFTRLEGRTMTCGLALALPMQLSYLPIQVVHLQK